MKDRINSFYIVKQLQMWKAVLSIASLNSLFCLVKNFTIIENCGIQKPLSMLRLNSVNICVYHVTAIQYTKIKYEILH